MEYKTTVAGQVLVESVQQKAVARVPTSWSDQGFLLRFALGGLEWQKQIPARILTTPWTRLSLQPIAPPWDETPREIALVVIPSQPVRESLPALSLVFGCFRYVLSQENRYVLRLEDGFEQYMAKFGAKQRHNLRRQARRLAEFCQGELRSVEYRTPAELNQFRGLAMQISKKSPMYLDGAGLPESEANWRQVYDSVLCGRSCVRMLFHATRPLAYVIALGQREADTLILWKLGYDPEYAAWSPGTVLLLQAIESLFSDGRFSLLDFGPMEFDYKRWFATGHQLCANILYFRASLKNAGLAGLSLAANQGSEFLGKLLTELGVKKQVRAALRFARRVGVRS